MADRSVGLICVSHTVMYTYIHIHAIFLCVSNVDMYLHIDIHIHAYTQILHTHTCIVAFPLCKHSDNNAFICIESPVAVFAYAWGDAFVFPLMYSPWRWHCA